MTTALLVYAHADDEIIFGHPFAFDTSIKKRLLICSSDAKNPRRSWCKNQPTALSRVADQLGFLSWGQLEFESEFSRLPSRAEHGPLLSHWWETAVKAIHTLSRDCDFIATHNPWGEYGHLDHLLVRRAVVENFQNMPTFWTDAWYRTKTWPIGDRCKAASDFDDNEIALDVEKYERAKKHYTDLGCFSWDNPVPSPVCISR